MIKVPGFEYKFEYHIESMFLVSKLFLLELEEIKNCSSCLNSCLIYGYFPYRRVKFLSLEGCSQLTTEGLESVILEWKELQSLRVVSCKNIKESSISPALSTLFSTFKDLIWRPDNKSLLPSSLIGGTHMGKKGGRFFKKTWDMKVLPGVHNHASARQT